MNKQSPYFFRPSKLIRKTAPRLIGSPWLHATFPGPAETNRNAPMHSVRRYPPLFIEIATINYVRDGSHRSIAPFSKERDFSSTLCDRCHARFLLRAIPWICARAPRLSHTNVCFSRERFGKKKQRIQTREISIHIRLGEPKCTVAYWAWM